MPLGSGDPLETLPDPPIERRETVVNPEGEATPAMGSSPPPSSGTVPSLSMPVALPETPATGTSAPSRSNTALARIRTATKRVAVSPQRIQDAPAQRIAPPPPRSHSRSSLKDVLSGTHPVPLLPKGPEEDTITPDMGLVAPRPSSSAPATAPSAPPTDGADPEPPEALALHAPDASPPAARPSVEPAATRVDLPIHTKIDLERPPLDSDAEVTLPPDAPVPLGTQPLADTIADESASAPPPDKTAVDVEATISDLKSSDES